MSIILGILVIGVAFLLYTMIDEWYIKPYEDLLHQRTVDELDNKQIIKSKNDLINELSAKIEELSSKKKVSKKSTEKKNKILVKLEPEDIVKGK